MGSSSNEIFSTDDMLINTIAISIDNIKITAVGLTCTSSNVSPVAAYCVINISSATAPPQNTASKLAAGYVGSNQSISWQGRITGEASQRLVAHIWSNTEATFRLTLLSE